MNNIKTDILVVGAGAAGIAASLSAVKMCKNVILAEQLSYVGGLITAGLVTLFVNMCRGNESEAIQAVLKETKKYGGIMYTKDGPIVNPEIFKIAVERMLINKGIKVLYNSHAYKVTKRNGIIEKVFFRNNYTASSIDPKVVIDCTGNGDIFYYCNEPFKEYCSKDIPIGLVVRIGGISEEAEKYLFSKVGKTFLKGLSIPEFGKTAMGSILWTTADYSDNKYGKEEYKNLTEILIYLRKRALEVSVNLRKNNIFKDSFLLDTAPLIGIRISRLLEGKSKLIPKFTKNLLVAGRCISVDFPTMEEMRVIPTCFATGEMAGVAAVNLLKDKEVKNE